MYAKLPVEKEETPLGRLLDQAYLLGTEERYTGVEVGTKGLRRLLDLHEQIDRMLHNPAMYCLNLLLRFLVVALAAAATIPSILSPGQKMQTKRSGNRKPSEETDRQDQKHPKYFHEAGGSMELGHYDVRYFQGKVEYAEHGPALRRLIRSWLETAGELGIQDATWLAHGTLLGWWWNGRVMPWDYDLDVQMPVATLTFLGRHFNRTSWDYEFLVEEGEGRGNGIGEVVNGSYVNKTYLLDVNPHHTDLGRGNGANVIDARWIDMSNGLFVDITGLAERDPAGSPGVWSCKNAHRYRTTELFPMRHTEFEGVLARVPYAFDKILTDEYGSKSLTTTEWANHHWIPELKEWVKIPEEEKKNETATKEQHGDNSVVVVVEKTVVKGGSKG
ncbi:LicD family-domain-containing protein [Hypoxylon trugodes]|uniref:LicD family-domain-containing protein n=1 Tax=Hypoxylon trugodes TaxID=326681 RepID=UPI002199B815|nr:LicD family-domain-containing protein [Hypoxylon trugodes]KAI1388255.1 LicD family-domain-containing protein [Hypoxylon trugodes]